MMYTAGTCHKGRHGWCSSWGMDAKLMAAAADTVHMRLAA